jgi:hypothetical protein
MHGLIRRAARRRQRASARRHFRHGWRAAAARAFTGAELYLNKTAPTLAAAAACCGSNVQYVQAAIVLIQDQKIRRSVLEGRVPLLAAAHEMRRAVCTHCCADLITIEMRLLLGDEQP